MMSITNILLIAMSMTLVAGQRPSFAGSRPIGFPEVIKTTTEGLGNRFGDDDTPTTTVRLPLEAKGDKDLVDRLSKLPVDQQPFWLINWQALEEQRKNPQTFQQKPNVFVDPMMPGSQQQAPQQQQQSFQQQQQAFQQQKPTFQQQQQNFQKPQSSQQPTQQVLTVKEFQDLQRMTYLQYLESQRNQQNNVNNQVKRS